MLMWISSYASSNFNAMCYRCHDTKWPSEPYGGVLGRVGMVQRAFQPRERVNATCTAQMQLQSTVCTVLLLPNPPTHWLCHGLLIVTENGPNANTCCYLQGGGMSIFFTAYFALKDKYAIAVRVQAGQ